MAEITTFGDAPFYRWARDLVDAYHWDNEQDKIKSTLHYGEVWTANGLAAKGDGGRASAWRYCCLMRPEVFGEPPNPYLWGFTAEDLAILSRLAGTVVSKFQWAKAPLSPDAEPRRWTKASSKNKPPATGKKRGARL